jgi:hypothetical protein
MIQKTGIFFPEDIPDSSTYHFCAFNVKESPLKISGTSANDPDSKHVGMNT